MKQLQDNYTTPEQSKRLLDLGLPADSADCYILNESQDESVYKNYTTLIIQPYMNKTNLLQEEGVLPCWSVGRLIKIYFICSFQPEMFIDNTIENLVDYLLGLFESVAMDFSKLEE